MNRWFVIAVVPCIGAVIAACGGRDTSVHAPGSSESTYGPSAPTTSSTSTAETTASAPATDEPRADTHAASEPETMATPLTDEQVLEVTHVANQGEIAQGKLAQQKAKDPRVKKFASMMVKDHGDADAKGAALAKKNQWSMTESPISTTLKSEGDTATQELKGLSGAEFDRAYVDAQVQAHRSVLDAIDRDLLPSARNEDVRTMLQTVRAKVAGHLDEAKRLSAALGS